MNIETNLLCEIKKFGQKKLNVFGFFCFNNYKIKSYVIMFKDLVEI